MSGRQDFATTDLLRLEVEEAARGVVTNLMRNPGPAGTALWAPAGGTASNAAGWARVTFTAAGGPSNTGINWADASIPAVPGRRYSAAASLRAPKAQLLALYLQFLDAGGVNVGNHVQAVVVPANTARRFVVENRLAPPGAVAIRVLTYGYAGTGAVPWAVGDYLEASSLMLNEGETVLPYFNGATADTPQYRYGWTGTAYASTSVREEVGSQVNMVQNPSGELGGFGWVTPVSGSTIRSQGGGTSLVYTSPGGVASYFYTELLPISAGMYATAAWYSTGGRARFEWINNAGAVIGSTPQNPLAAGNQSHGAYQAPAGTVGVRLRFDHVNSSGGNAGAGDTLTLRDVVVVKALTAGVLGTVRTNLVPNPSFEASETGWQPRGAGVIATRARVNTIGGFSGSWCLRITAQEAGDIFASQDSASAPTHYMPVVAGRTYRWGAYFRGPGGRIATIGVWWYNGDAYISPSPGGGVTVASGTWGRSVGVATAPPGATRARLYLRIIGAAANEQHYVDAVQFEQSTTAALGAYFDGSTAPPAGTSNSWSGAAHASPSLSVSTQVVDAAPMTYLDVLGPSLEISVEREELNVGTLTATIRDSTLDPARSDQIRPGRRVRLLARTSTEDSWAPVYSGTATNAKVTYALKDPRVPESRRAKIDLTVTDNIGALAGVKRTQGVATIAQLPFVLEGCGVPWNVNGSGQQVASATVVANNENASALDQVAITRDSQLGYAWVDRFNTVQVHPRTAWNATVKPSPSISIDAEDYTELDIDYDTERCINSVTLKFLRLNPSTGETEEITYGPYRDEVSIAEWDVRAAEFTIQGIAEETSALAAYAQSILAANGRPQVRCNAVTVALRTPAQVAYFCAVDLYSKAAVEAPDSTGWMPEQFVTGISHRITPEKWLVTFKLASGTGVAPPQFTPSPEQGAGGKTIGQLLRPVGEVTMFYGAKSAIPVGWLACDGATFSASLYPELRTLLGGTTLPNLTDRFPVGAGTKALGTSGGDPSKMLATTNLPPVSATLAAGGGSAGDNDGASVVQGATGGRFSKKLTADQQPLDVMPPWRAVWFIIRAR